MAQVVFTNTSGTGTTNGSLFNGTKFWLSARVPLKKQFTEEIKVGLLDQKALRSHDLTALAGQWGTDRATREAG